RETPDNRRRQYDQEDSRRAPDETAIGVIGGFVWGRGIRHALTPGAAGWSFPITPWRRKFGSLPPARHGGGGEKRDWASSRAKRSNPVSNLWPGWRRRVVLCTLSRDAPRKGVLQSFAAPLGFMKSTSDVGIRMVAPRSLVVS